MAVLFVRLRNFMDDSSVFLCLRLVGEKHVSRFGLFFC
jgi:hypothetical protein